MLAGDTEQCWLAGQCQHQLNKRRMPVPLNAACTADAVYLVHESTGKLQLGAELDQGLLENQVLCIVHTLVTDIVAWRTIRCEPQCSFGRRHVQCMHVSVQGCVFFLIMSRQGDPDQCTARLYTLPLQASRPQQAAMTSAAASRRSSSSACITDSVKAWTLCTNQTRSDALV